MNAKKPYPMPAEILRTVSNALDIKCNKKILDDSAFNPNIPYYKIEVWIEDLAGELEKFNLDFSKKVEIYLKALMKNYLSNIVGKGVNSNNDNRDEIFHIIAPFFIDYFIQFVKDIGVENDVIGNGQNPISDIINWIEVNEPNWNKIKFTKDDKDKIYKWKSGEHSPNKQSIKLLACEYKNVNINWDKITQLLIVARAIKYLNQYINSYKILSTEKDKQQQKILQLMRNFDTAIQSRNPKVNSHKTIQELELEIGKLKNSNGFNYVIYNLKALRYVLVGDLAKAHNFYKKTFEACLYRSKEMKPIIERALVVAVHQKKIDKAFIRNLINAQITFGYEVPIHYKSNDGKLKVADVIQDWQIEVLKLKFHTMFPDEVLFKGVSYPVKNYRVGPVSSVIDKIKPDFTNPNKKIKVGEWNKIIPQLVYFSQLNEIDNVKTLLKKGASVDALSESNESAIGMALESASIFEYKTPNQELFNLISQFEHNPTTLNIRTNKKKLLPIISAVETSSPDIVKKVLDMGADPNILGSTDECSALYTCLLYINALKNDKLRDLIFSGANYTSLEALDSYKRYMMGGLPKDDDEYKKIFDMLVENQIKNIQKYGSLKDFYRIAYLLLDNNANPNQEIVLPIKGYTPLMLAVEFDELKLVEKMIEQGGDIDKSYSLPSNSLQQIDCQKIAEGFKSEKVLEMLKNL